MGVGAGLYMYDVVVKKFTFAISSPDELLLRYARLRADRQTCLCVHRYASRDRTSSLRGEVSKSIDGVMLTKPALGSFIAYSL